MFLACCNVPREGSRVVGALSGDGAGHLVASPVRKERLARSKKELAEEAARVLHQADGVDCITRDQGVPPERFYTLPARKKHREYNSSSLDRKKRRNSDEIRSDSPPKKPPRTFEATKKNAILGLFKKEAPKKSSNLKRSVSDATNLKSKAFGPHGDEPFRKRSGSQTNDTSLKAHKKQLSPIIEQTQREDYFSDWNNKENISLNGNNAKNESVTEKLKEYIDEVDTALFEETGIRASPVETKPEVVIIDVDKAEVTGKKGKKSKVNALGKKLKSLTKKAKPKTKDKDTFNTADTVEEEIECKPETIEVTTPTRIEETIQCLENNGKQSPTMIHSSQMPADKPPLTRGRTVDRMVKRLSNDNCSPPPPKTNIMITPNVSVQHNNNQPFSYTRGISPEKENSPIIYAQVVCGSNGNKPSKQTVHTTYVNGKKHFPHSDSDEGLGYEENPGFRRKLRDDEEFPITPKFRTNGYGYSDYEKKFTETVYIDSSSRGRGDGMDAKRRESLTESFDNGFNTPPKASYLNGRSDLSARRDQLESRINRRLGLRQSPEYTPNKSTNVYISESSSKYYRGGSKSPTGYKETYTSESKTDDRGEKFRTESREKEYFGDPNDAFDSRYKLDYLGFENEPKSFDSQISDYRSSPENRNFDPSHDYRSPYNKYKSKAERQTLTNREYFKSNPEIYRRNYEDEHGTQESYHDSLRRDRYENKMESTKRYFDNVDRKDRFGDSGIENDFRRDSGDNIRVSRHPRREFSNDSEDEGFASSLLIASERQHTEDNFITRKQKHDYDSDRSYRKYERDDYRHVDGMEHKAPRRETRNEYVPRERSIDDGSHYDPRIDKDVDGGTLKRFSDRKPPKPEKKSSLEKVKQLFSRDSKKNKKEKTKPAYDNHRSRYTEYRGSKEHLEPRMEKGRSMNELNTSYDYSNRRRLSTPSPSPTRQTQRNGKPETHGSWFKSLDRLSRKKPKKTEKEGNLTSTEDESSQKPLPTKNLRFFGDTDAESNDSLRQKPSPRTRSGVSALNQDRIRSQSTRDLHNISEELHSPELRTRRSSQHKSMTNIAEPNRRDSRMNGKPPISPNHRSNSREATRSRDDRSRRRKNEVSSVESSTEGDSSQQSQRSVVYLHAATVGDIPGPGYLRNGRRAASREELASNSSSRMQPQVKTLSRSFSVLAPWRPRHYKESMDIDYTQYPKQKYEQKPTRNGTSRKENSSTLKKRAQETKRSTQTLNRNRSKESISKSKDESASRGSNSTLYKKRERQPKENTRYNRDDKKISSKSMSMESLGNRSDRKNGDLSRSISMPRDPEKSAGWFKKTKKSGSTQRL